MADIQKQFREFHDTIKLDDENEILREKREIIIRRLKEKLSDRPSFEHFVQGSYAMSTGIKPLDGVYDIDVGISFNVDKKDYKDPVELKRWVADALKSYTNKDPEIKDACVRVTYIRDGEDAFCVDLPVYAGKNQDGKLYLARGREYSSEDKREWQASDPKGLIQLIRDHFDDKDDRSQFRRVVRALKRWSQIKFDGEGHGKPTGVALTVSAYQWMKPEYTVDSFSKARRYNDLKAMLGLVNEMINNFKIVLTDDGFAKRIIVKSPVDPEDDLFAKMTNKQMDNFKQKLEVLRDALEYADAVPDPVEACETLRSQIGDEFPVPPKYDTGQSTNRAIVTGSESA